MFRRPKAGLFLLAAKWFWDNKMLELGDLLKMDMKRIEEKLERYMDVVSSGLVCSEDEAKRAARVFIENNVDFLIVCSVAWCEDQPLIALLNEISGIHIPIILWCYTPYEKPPLKMSVIDLLRGSGVVGTLQISGVIKRLAKDFWTVLGNADKEEVLTTIYEFGKAAKLSKELKKVKIGLLPYRCNVMTNTFIDEFNLMKHLGPVVKYISVAELFSASQEMKNEEIQSFIDYLKKNYEVIGVSDKSLLTAARVSLSLAKVVGKHGLDAVAMDDLNEELHRTMKTRPCLYFPSMFEKGVSVGMEGDIACTTSMIILSRLTNNPPMFTEIFTFDKKDNTILMGHAGMHNVELAKDKEHVKITVDYEYEASDEVEGAWMQFIAKEGRVTLLSISSEGDSFKTGIATGESLPGEEKLKGYPHMLVKLDVPVDVFFKTIMKAGFTQHWAVVHGDISRILIKLADILGLKKIIMTTPVESD